MGLKIRFEIELGNDAMQSPADVGRMLRDWLSKYTGAGSGGQFYFRHAVDRTKLRDVNGNTVGFWEVVETHE